MAMYPLHPLPPRCKIGDGVPVDDDLAEKFKSMAIFLKNGGDNTTQ